MFNNIVSTSMICTMVFTVKLSNVSTTTEIVKSKKKSYFSFKETVSFFGNFFIIEITFMAFDTELFVLVLFHRMHRKRDKKYKPLKRKSGNIVACPTILKVELWRFFTQKRKDRAVKCCS